jgi:hypothetical protein
MTVFQLVLHVCLTINGYDGTLTSKTCRWDAMSLYRSEDRCNEAGASQLMKEMFGDSCVIDGSGSCNNGRVEGHRCARQRVE